jgi:hypothetical protein
VQSFVLIFFYFRAGNGFVTFDRLARSRRLAEWSRSDTPIISTNIMLCNQNYQLLTSLEHRFAGFIL